MDYYCFTAVRTKYAQNTIKNTVKFTSELRVINLTITTPEHR